MKTQEEYAAEYAKLPDEKLLDEFGNETWASDRCVGSDEHEDSANSLAASRAELLNRLARGRTR